MTPEEELELLTLEKEKRRRARAKDVQGEQEVAGEDEGEGEGEDDDTSHVGETIYDLGNGAMKGITFGFDDVAAGAGAWAGDAFQSWRDGRERDPTAYQQGVDDRRAEVKASKERSPTATTIGEVGGALATAPLSALRAGKVARVATGAGTGALAALGFGDADTVGDAVEDAAGGALAGGVLAGLAPLVPAAFGAVANKVKGTTKEKAIELALKAAKEAEEWSAKNGFVGYAGGKLKAAAQAAAKPAPVPVVPAASPQLTMPFIDLADEAALAAMTPAQRALELEARKKALAALAGQ